MLASGSCIHFILCFLILCPLPRQVRLWAMLKAILPDNIILKLSDTSEGIRVSWTRPDATIDPHCYESELRYRSSCDTDWLNVRVRKFHHEVKPDRKKRYEFQVRMRYDTICGNQNEWSTWTRKLSWEIATQKESCTVEGYSPDDISLYLGTILPCLCVILAFLLLLKRIRGFFLPSVPGPKPFPDKLPSIEQFHCQYVYTETSQACETVDIEIVRQGDEDDRESGVSRENEKVNTENENHCVDLYDTGLHGFPSLVDNGAYLKFFEQAVEER